MIPNSVVRVALVIGACVDGGVALLALFFQNLLGPVLDVPTKDPALTTFIGGELAVVTGLYIVLFRNLDRYRALLWLVALDQFFAAVLPAIEIARGHVTASIKTVGPIPLSATLVAIFLLGMRNRKVSKGSG